jgi:hypothetical protein
VNDASGEKQHIDFNPTLLSKFGGNNDESSEDITR